LSNIIGFSKPYPLLTITTLLLVQLNFKHNSIIKRIAMSAVTPIPTDWNSQCMALIRNASNFTEGLVNGLGQHVAKFDETAWGVDISTCYKYCGSIRFPVSHYCFCRLRWTRVMPCLPVAEDESQ
jgi:hypothetical protein